MTRFLLYHTHIRTNVLESVVPPVYQRNLAPLPEWRADESETLTAEIALDQAILNDVTQIIPCCSSLGSAGYAFQFSVQGMSSDGVQSEWQHLATIGNVKDEMHETSDKKHTTENGERNAKDNENISIESLHDANSSSPIPHPSSLASPPFILSDIDRFLLKTPLTSAIIRVTVASSDRQAFRKVPSLISLSLSGNGVSPGAFPAVSLDIPVPRKSQRLEDPAIQDHICSPTCISMLLDYWGKASTVAEVADKAYNQQHGMYGVWPANIWAASRRGLLGYLLRFSSWQEVEWLLQRGIPLVVSVNYRKGELTDAAVDRTKGHLLILRGLQHDRMLVNDPASHTVERVFRKYRREEFERVWLKRRGIGYVIFPA